KSTARDFPSGENEGVETSPLKSARCSGALAKLVIQTEPAGTSEDSSPMNASLLLSGDQTGSLTPRLPGTVIAVGTAEGCASAATTYNWLCVMYATRLPSGEMVTWRMLLTCGIDAISCSARELVDCANETRGKKSTTAAMRRMVSNMN